MTTTQVPQRMIALDRANSIRISGARIRREMHALDAAGSRRQAAILLLDPPEPIAHMRLSHFLTGMRGVSHHNARVWMSRAELSPSLLERKVGPLQATKRTPTPRFLTARQREAIAHALHPCP